jgi:hypothetical protein
MDAHQAYDNASPDDDEHRERVRREKQERDDEKLEEHE